MQNQKLNDDYEVVPDISTSCTPILCIIAGVDRPGILIIQWFVGMLKLRKEKGIRISYDLVK